LVAAETSRSEFTPEGLLAERGTLYVESPVHEQRRLRSVFLAIIQDVVAYAYEHAPLDPPLPLLLDEAANIAPLPDLDQLASTGAGLGLQLCSVFHDFGQVEARWGHDWARTIASNHRALLALAGLKDLGSLRLKSDLAGDHEQPRVSQSYGDGGSQTTTAPELAVWPPSNNSGACLEVPGCCSTVRFGRPV
jgi:type IV secretory pathway TraG/TraD family ATPase VirD4